MEGISKFEDLIAWQKARELTRDVYSTTRRSPFSRDLGLCSQVQRAAVSVMANVAEGFERRGNQEFSRYLTMAKASCAEVQSHLYVALDLEYLVEDDFQRLMVLAKQTSRIIAGLKKQVDATAPARLPKVRTSVPGTRY